MSNTKNADLATCIRNHLRDRARESGRDVTIPDQQMVMDVLDAWDSIAVIRRAAAALAHPLPAQAPRPEAEIVQAGIDDYGRTSLAKRVMELTPLQVMEVNRLLDGEAQEPAAFAVRTPSPGLVWFYESNADAQRKADSEPGTRIVELFERPPPAAQDAQLLRAALALIEDIEHSGAAKEIAKRIQSRLEAE